MLEATTAAERLAVPFAAFRACGRAVATQPLVALLAASLGHCFWRVAVHAKLSWCTWALCRAALRRKVKQQLFCFFLLLHGRSRLRLEEHGLLLCGGFAQQGLQRRRGLQLLAVGALGALRNVSVVPILPALLAAVGAAMPTNDLRVSRVAAGGCP
mgnify:CR=1 FL=1